MNLNQVTLGVTDIEASTVFYQRLGLQVIVDSTEYVRFLCPVGGATFSIHRVDDVPAAATRVYFETDQLDAEVARLQALGVVFDQLPKDESWRWREARLRDPDGNPLTLYYGGANRVNPPWRVNPDASSAPASVDP